MCVFFLQLTNVTSDYIVEIINKFEVSDENKQTGVMGIEGNFNKCNFTFPLCKLLCHTICHFTFSVSAFKLPVIDTLANGGAKRS